MRVLLILLLLFFTFNLYAQAPQRGQRTPEQPAEVAAPVVDNSPLVRPFGEPQITLWEPILQFGMRPPTLPAPPSLRQPPAPIAATQQQTVTISGVYDNVSAELKSSSFSWFFEFDANQDGQISMVEYIAASTLPIGAAVAEFVMLDLNGDGFVTMQEALQFVKEDYEARSQAAPVLEQRQPQNVRRARGGT